MFMRFLHLKNNPRYANEFKKFYESTVFPQLQKMQGCLFAGLIKSKPEYNEFVSLTFWQTQEQAENYEKNGVFQNLLEKAKKYLADSTEWKIQLSENMELEYAPITDEPVIKKYSVEAKKDEDIIVSIPDDRMFLRIVSVKIQAGKLNEFKDIYTVTIIPALKATKGCRYVFLTESINEKDEFISVTIWDKKEFAEEYESSGKFNDLVDKVKHTFSEFYLWKMALEKEYSAKIKTTEDLKVEAYNIVTGKSFL